MRPRFGSAIADCSAHATADPNRWTHRVGVSGRARDNITPTRNAIGLRLPVAFEASVEVGTGTPLQPIVTNDGA